MEPRFASKDLKTVRGATQLSLSHDTHVTISFRGVFEGKVLISLNGERKFHRGSLEGLSGQFSLKNPFLATRVGAYSYRRP